MTLKQYLASEWVETQAGVGFVDVARVVGESIAGQPLCSVQMQCGSKMLHGDRSIAAANAYSFPFLRSTLSRNFRTIASLGLLQNDVRMNDVSLMDLHTIVLALYENYPIDHKFEYLNFFQTSPNAVKVIRQPDAEAYVMS